MWARALWVKVVLDVVYMPSRSRKNFLIVLRKDLLGWPEARALRKADLKSIAKFLQEVEIYNYGIFGKLVIDRGPENKGALIVLAKRYSVYRVIVLAYNPLVNKIVKRGYKPIVDSLSKLTEGGSEDQTDHLSAVLLADRTTVKQTTSQTPFYLNRGAEAVLLIETRILIQRILNQGNIKSTSNLLALRTRQLEQRDKDLKEAAAIQKRIRIRGKD